jgi:hypothetical protein
MSRTCDPTTGKVWRRRLQRFLSSGLSVSRFCVLEGVSVPRFYYWRKKLALEAGSRAIDRRGAFRAVQVVPAVPGVSIHLPCGTRIEVRADDLDSLRAVVAEVARANREWEGDGAC